MQIMVRTLQIANGLMGGQKATHVCFNGPCERPHGRSESNACMFQRPFSWDFSDTILQSPSRLRVRNDEQQQRPDDCSSPHSHASAIIFFELRGRHGIEFSTQSRRHRKDEKRGARSPVLGVQPRRIWTESRYHRQLSTISDQPPVFAGVRLLKSKRPSQMFDMVVRKTCR